MNPLLYVALNTFCFSGAVAAAAWGEFYWDKIAGAIVCGGFWLRSFFLAWRAAERFHADAHARGCSRERVVIRSDGATIVDVPCPCRLDALYEAMKQDSH